MNNEEYLDDRYFYAAIEAQLAAQIAEEEKNLDNEDKTFDPRSQFNTSRQKDSSVPINMEDFSSCQYNSLKRSKTMDKESNMLKRVRLRENIDQMNSEKKKLE